MIPGSIRVHGSQFTVHRPGLRAQGSRFTVHGSEIGPLEKDRHLRSKPISVNCELLTVNQGGFTFVELMIVLMVIGILVTLAQPNFSTSVWRAREATLKENLFIFRDVINQYYADNGQYPPTLEALVEMRYLRRIPKDPITGVDDTWLIVPAVDELGQDQGIFDVRSGSDMLALDGTSYQEW